MKNIHVLPTDKPSRLTLLNDERLLFSKEDCETSKTKRCVNQNIYITSDEEIKEGDWYNYLGQINKRIRQNHRAEYPYPNYQKIILTTDQDLIKDGVQAIDDEFLEWFIKNPSCDEVEVNLVPVNEFGSEITVNGYGFDKFIYKIIIPKEAELDKLKKQFQIKANEALELNSKIGNFGKPKEEPKQETLEEASINYLSKVADGKRNTGYADEDFIAGAKWQAERMFSEQDMIEFGEWCENLQKDNKDIRRTNPDITRKELLEIWKKEFKNND